MLSFYMFNFIKFTIMKKLLLLFGFLCLGMVNVNAQGVIGSHVTGLKGYVTDVNNVAIPNATVIIWSYGDENQGLPTDEPYVLISGKTDNTGFYCFEDDEDSELLSAGFFAYITVEADGYKTLKAECGIVQWEITEQNFTLEKNASDGLKRIRGIVKDEQGNPLADMEVSVYLRALVGDAPDVVYTDANGKYIIDLPDSYFGNLIYSIMVSGEIGDLYYFAGEQNITLSDDITIVNFTLYGSEIPGMESNGPVYKEYIVVDATSGKPIEGVSLTEFNWFDDINGNQLLGPEPPVFTDEYGCYSKEVPLFEWIMRPAAVLCEVEGYSSQYIELHGDYKTVIYMEKDNAVSDDAGLVDSINSVKDCEKVSKHFNVSGLEISPNVKGLHIVNGKKILVK